MQKLFFAQQTGSQTMQHSSSHSPTTICSDSKILTTYESSDCNSAAMALPFLLPSVNKEYIAKKRVGPRRK
jgi:hypothetical protein